ncbi:MAG TPA: efflux RND transporter periplasmic adaptor subunit [Chryseolinea sp.]|nr:efflux RND transporter periplasmic adaptor subunit [Chryseolinea sp.]
MEKSKTHAAVTTIVILSLASFLQSCTDGKSAVNVIPKGSDPIPVKVVSLAKSGKTSVINVSGQLTTNEESTLGFKTGGVVNSVLVREGDAVTKGQLLATLDLTEINTFVAQAKFGYEKALRDHQRLTNLYRDSVATLEQLQNAETYLAVAKQQLDAAGFNRAHSEIHAPANGFVLKKFVNTGQVVSTGDPVLLTNAVSAGNWILKVGVSDKQWTLVNVGDKATVRLDAIPEKILQATVKRKSETTDPATGVFAVDLSIQHDGSKLATGMFGSATLQSGGNIFSWSVPYESVLDANGNEGYVFITNDNKTAHKQLVEIESFNDKTMRISGGLEDAKALIVSGSAYLTDNTPIQIIK